MKRLLPSRTELAILTTAAILCAAIAGSSESRDVILSLMAIPLFIVSALMGLRRSPQWTMELSAPVDSDLADE